VTVHERPVHTLRELVLRHAGKLGSEGVVSTVGKNMALVGTADPPARVFVAWRSAGPLRVRKRDSDATTLRGGRASGRPPSRSNRWISATSFGSTQWTRDKTLERSL
jgi:hypothetical protein